MPTGDPLEGRRTPIAAPVARTRHRTRSHIHKEPAPNTRHGRSGSKTSQFTRHVLIDHGAVKRRGANPPRSPKRSLPPSSLRIDPMPPLRGSPSDMPSLHDDKRTSDPPGIAPGRPQNRSLFPDVVRSRNTALPLLPGKFGGARRDRTDDLKLAKLPLSQLSYGPNPSCDTTGGQAPLRRWTRVHQGGPPAAHAAKARNLRHT